MGKTFTLKLFDQNDQASFAQAVEIALAQSRVELHTPGALMQEPVRSIVIGKDRLVPVALPQPGRYYVHKLAVSALRAPGSSKADKDVLQAAVLAAVLAATREFELEEAADEANRTLRQKAHRGATQALRLLGDDYPEAVVLLERLAV
jgi:hypothetical protein